MAAIARTINLCILLLKFQYFLVKADDDSWVLISGSDLDSNITLSEGLYGATQNLGVYGSTQSGDRYATTNSTNSNFAYTSDAKIVTMNPWSNSILNSGNVRTSKLNVPTSAKSNQNNPEGVLKPHYENSLEAVQLGPTQSISRHGSSLLSSRNEAGSEASIDKNSGQNRADVNQKPKHQSISVLSQNDANPGISRYGTNLVPDRRDDNQGASVYGSTHGEKSYTNVGANAGILTYDTQKSENFRQNEKIEPCNFPYIYFPERDPVLLNYKCEIIKPRGDGIQLQPGELIHLACAGNGNFLEASAQELTSATCVGGRILKVKGEKRDIAGLNCIRPVSGDIKISQKQCANGKGRLFSVGHKINETLFVAIIEGCYDFHDAIAMFTEHTIYGSALRHAKSYPRKPNQKNTADIIVFNPDAYSIKKQIQTFENYFGKSQNYLTSNSYLRKTLLSPEEDFVFTSSRWSVNFHLNSVPQWYQTKNNRNMKTLEDMIRKLATKEEKDIRVITGSHDVLVLGGKLIYLANGKLPIPALTWKVIQDTNSKLSIGFVTLNNAFGPIDISKCCLCPDISAQYGWQNEDFGDYKKGLTYACDVNNMKTLFLNIPELSTKGILMGPNFVGVWNTVSTQQTKSDNSSAGGFAPKIINTANFSNVSATTVIVY